MKKYLLSLKEKAHILQNIYIKNKFYKKKKTYSMHGEDLVVKEYFKNVNNGFYIDIGCYHPLQHNNTMLLYKKGWTGINVDVSDFSIKLFNFCRPKDLNLNIAVSSKNEDVNLYYQKNLSQLSTLVKSQSKIVFQGKIKERKILSKTLTNLLDTSIYKNKKIDFLDLDIEGADFDVLKSLDFSRYQPRLISVEILSKNMNMEKKNFIEINSKAIEKSEIYIFLVKKNYKKIWSGIYNHIFELVS